MPVKSMLQNWDVGCRKAPESVTKYFCQTDRNLDTIRGGKSQGSEESMKANFSK